jgi:hypothetical protein
MAVITYMDLIEQMKALADKINKHYDKVTTIETEIPIEDEKTRILQEAGIVEDKDDETSEDESTVAEETEAQSDEEETIDEVESTEDDEKDRIREQLDIMGVENDEHINVVGTGRRGEIKARYDDLVRIFGEPTKSKERGDQMDKTNAEWMLEFEVRDEDDPEDTDLIVATIYDWKYPELPRDEVQWNVGGKTWKSYEAVTDYIDSHGATTESDEGTDLQQLMKLAGTE